VSRLFIFTWSHSNTHHSRYHSSGRGIGLSQRPLPDNTNTVQETNIHARGGIRNHDSSKRSAADLRLRPRGYWDRPEALYLLLKNGLWQLTFTLITDMTFLPFSVTEILTVLKRKIFSCTQPEVFFSTGSLITLLRKPVGDKSEARNLSRAANPEHVLPVTLHSRFALQRDMSLCCLRQLLTSPFPWTDRRWNSNLTWKQENAGIAFLEIFTLLQTRSGLFGEIGADCYKYHF
jgi:hypothetical protein